MKVDWNTIPVAPGMRPGATRQWVAGERVSLTRVVTAADAVFDGSLHHHEHEQWLVVLSGLLRLRIDAEDVEAGPGDLVVFPSRCVHGATGVGPEGAVYYEWFAPPRYDGLPGWVAGSPLTWVNEDRKP